MTSDNRRLHLGGTARSPEDVISLHRLGLQFAEVPITNPEKFSADVERFRHRVQEAAKKAAGNARPTAAQQVFDFMSART